MLQAIREKAQGWIAWAIVIMITIPFALWGIQEYLGVGSDPDVATVNGDPITGRTLDQKTRDYRENLRATLGNQVPAEMLDDTVLKPRVLDALIEEKVLGDTAIDWNLRSADAQVRGFIASLPAFQRDGRFDQAAYESAVRNRGMSAAGFEQSVRQDLVARQLRAGIADSAFVTETALVARVGLMDQKREVNYAVVPAAAYRDQIAVTDQLLQDYYGSHTDRYQLPDRVKLNYLVLNAADLGGFVDASEASLRQYFDDHRAEFVGREERAMRHILVSVPAGADDKQVEAARNKAQGLLDRLHAGESFAALAKASSDDPGSASNGGDLGWVERGTMVPPFEEAAFALGKGATSGIVQTDFGFHIVQVTDIRGGSDATFEDMRTEVDKAYRRFEGENLYFEYAERLAQSAYENSDSLVPAAEALGLTVQSSDWLARDSQPDGALGNPKVLNAAFSDDVLGERHNSELIEVGPQQSVVVRVVDYAPAGARPFAEIVAEVREDFIREKAAGAASATGARALEELNAGKSLEEIAASNAWRLEHPGKLARNAEKVPAEVVAKAFELPPLDAGKPRYAGVESPDGDFLLVELTAVQNGSFDDVSVAERPLLAEQAGGQLGAAEVRYVTQSLRDAASIEVSPQKVE
ncbi:MAG: SurA N-terminal domain-containing protein [Gammaproteobacteria bacterium]|nr:SurA N-terminal domain-containing protein [Gammaproteobacteria bacterium]MCP5299249.1 SurA N-terminal domain-containing protein [Chromatiaceae bacterium]